MAPACARHVLFLSTWVLSNGDEEARWLGECAALRGVMREDTDGEGNGAQIALAAA